MIVQEPGGQTSKLPLPADVGPRPEDGQHVLLSDHLDESEKRNIKDLILEVCNYDLSAAFQCSRRIMQQTEIDSTTWSRRL